MRVKNLLLFFFAGISFGCMAQYQQNLPQAKPIPANAAALFKTLEKPMGTYTGTIPVSFPVCSVSSGSLSAIVSLDYNSTGGIKVEELGGPVGLGFNLSDGGGRITQMVRGRPDDAVDGFLHTSYKKPSQFDCNNMTDVYNSYMNEMDLEPDLYAYSIPGHSGKFFIKEDGSTQVTKNDNIKIEYTWNSTYGRFGSFTITDERGNKYYFNTNVTNQSTYSSNGGSTSANVTSQSWFLDSMKDMNLENKIKFTYTTTGNTFTTITGSFWMLTPIGMLDCGGFNTSNDVGTVTTDGSEYLVSRIDASNGYIVFNSTVAYPYGPKKITSIKLYDPNSNLKKQYNFNYGASFSSNRLRLDNFSEFGSSGTDSLTTKFDYNTFDNLPTVMSDLVDFWGYYNNASNPGFLPNIIYNNGGFEYYFDQWANRLPNGTYAQANILTKITYPSGGSRQLFYEGNTVLPNGDFFFNHPDDAFLSTQSFNETSFTNHGTSAPSLQHIFHINSPIGFSKFYYTINNPSWQCGTDYTVKIIAITSSTDYTGGYQIGSFNGQSTGSQQLDNGYYRVDLFINNNNYTCSMNGLSGTWKETYSNNTTINTPNGTFYKQMHNAGGVRIKEIDDYDRVTNKTNKRMYRYKLYSTDSTVTSGLVVSPVNMVGIENISACGCSYQKLFPGSSYPLATENGSYVVYPEVRTIDSANGWTDRYFSYYPDIPTSSYPSIPSTDYSGLRGNLLEERTYNNSGTLLKKTVNSYTGWGSQSQMGLKVKAYWFHTISEPFTYREYPLSTELPNMSACNTYSLFQNSQLLIQSTDSVYSSFGTQVVRTNYDYYYNSTAYPKRKTVYINGNKTKEQTYKYAFSLNSDFNLGITAGESSMKTTLLNQNYMLPLEVVDSLKANGGSPTFLSGAKYIFGKFNADSSIQLKTYRGYTTATDSLEINFSAYDSSGNLREQYKTNNEKDVYIWGYNRTYLVAKITGSNLSTVLSFINIGVINNPSSDAALRTELDKIRTGLAGSLAQVTTYTYSPIYGMTSMTDPAGRIIYYEYDSFGRLIRVRDQNNNILNKYDYKVNNP